jgi:hypothetical protein
MSSRAIEPASESPSSMDNTRIIRGWGALRAAPIAIALQAIDREHYAGSNGAPA